MLPRGVDVVLESYMSTHWRREDARARVFCFNCKARGHYSAECDWWKTRLCREMANNTCGPAISCSFAHGVDELRSERVLLRTRASDWRRTVEESRTQPPPDVPLLVSKPPEQIRLRPGA